MNRLLLVAALSLLCGAAHAQYAFPTPNSSNVGASVPMCDNGSSQWVPCTLSNPLPTTPVLAFNYANITTATTTTLKSGPGVLHIVNVNSLGTVASVIQIYDSTTGSGTLIGTVNALAVLGTVQYDVVFTTGLTLVTTGVLPPNITVSYK